MRQPAAMVVTPAMADAGRIEAFAPRRAARKPVYRLYRGALDELASPSPRGGRLIVTPNADHLRLLSRSRALRRAYAAADVVMNDSRALDRAFLRGAAFCLTGADLAREMIDRAPDGTRLCVVGYTPLVQAALTERRPGLASRFINPSMGFIAKRAERRRLARDIVAGDPAIVFVCTGAPQSEVFAAELKAAGCKADILCCGSGLMFLSGASKRAPLWMQNAGLEWLWRMIQEPRTRSRYAKDLWFILTHLRPLLGLARAGSGDFGPFRLRVGG